MAEHNSAAPLISAYGIGVTVLLCLLIVMYAILYSSTLRPTDQHHIADIPLPTVPCPPTTTEALTEAPTEAPPDPARELDRAARQIRLMLMELELAGTVEADYDALSLTIRLPDSMFFAEGDAELIDGAYGPLNAVVDILVRYSGAAGGILVACHTDSVPPESSLFRDNWELSGIRAARSAKYILQTGRIREGTVSYSGYGDTRPIADSATPEGRQANRRLEFVLENIDILALSALDETESGN